MSVCKSVINQKLTEQCALPGIIYNVNFPQNYTLQYSHLESQSIAILSHQNFKNDHLFRIVYL